MTESLNEFLDLCKERIGAKTDSQLAMKIGITRSAMSQYRQGKILPSDLMVSQLATRAKLDVDISLLWLNVWRAKEPVRGRYVQMVKKFSGVAMAFALYVSPLAPHSEKVTENNTLQANNEFSVILRNINYAISSIL